MYSFDWEALEKVAPRHGMQIFIYDDEGEGIVLGVNAALEWVSSDQWSGWRARPDHGTWLRGRLTIEGLGTQR
jgi:hypothetical protein